MNVNLLLYIIFFKNSDLVIYIWTSGYRYETIAKNIISILNEQ